MDAASLLSNAKHQKISSDADVRAKLPNVDVGPEALQVAVRHGNRYSDPSEIPAKYMDSNVHYRWVNLSKIDYRRFQGYDTVRYEDCPIHKESTEHYVQLGDCILMKVAMRQYEQALRDREEYWQAMWNRKVEESFVEADRINPGGAFIIDKGKEVR
jgi:hypothetical protein